MTLKAKSGNAAAASSPAAAPSTTANGTTSSPRPTARPRTFTLYLDGKQGHTGPGIGAGRVPRQRRRPVRGRHTQGHDLNGAIDFLRLARGTLADSKTTIDELYAWEFRGPFLRGFHGPQIGRPTGDAGAIDAND